jgi:hypothetical protein
MTNILTPADKNPIARDIMESFLGKPLEMANELEMIAAREFNEEVGKEIVRKLFEEDECTCGAAG